MANTAGGIYVQTNSTLVINCSNFTLNSASQDGGSALGYNSDITIHDSIFSSNEARWGGAVVAYEQATIAINECRFLKNTAVWGGALASHLGTLTLNDCILSHNYASKQGGVASFDFGLLIMDSCYITHNTADMDGGALIGVNSRLALYDTRFSNNSAQLYGAVLRWSGGIVNTYNTLHLESNSATVGLLYLYDIIANFTGNVSFVHNHGSVYTFSSTVTFSGNTIFRNCSSLGMLNATQSFRRSIDNVALEGGAVSATFESVVNFIGHCEFTNNSAKAGGGLMITESKVTFYGSTKLADNTASITGGGVYLHHSEINCFIACKLLVRSNSAAEKGGGIHSISSVIKVKNPQSTIHIIENEANIGGGICLEMNARIYVFNSDYYSQSHEAITFTANKAKEKGGAIYVLDGPHTCSSTISLPYITSECCLQSIENREIRSLYLQRNFSNPYDRSVTSLFFHENVAKSGPAMYGGLIGSCTINHPEYAPGHSNKKTGNSLRNVLTVVNATTYIDSISNIQMSHVTSDPIQICICRNGWPDCSLQTCPIRIFKGEDFTVSIAAVDQTHHPISATVYSSFKSRESDLTRHELKVSPQNNSICTNLAFKSNVPKAENDVLKLHVEGPCKDTTVSTRTFEIQFQSCSVCPIGFELSLDDATCDCVCDLKLRPYVTVCNSSSQTLLREFNFWLHYVNMSSSSGYILYPYCPMDYCHPPSELVHINLNLDNGSDAQCAFKRTGVLCGSCQPGLSLSLGSSLCLHCEQDWPVKFVFLTLAGMFTGLAITATILFLNLTVAVGTINGVIFYANILAATYSTYLPSDQLYSQIARGFVSFLNLEFPTIDVCYLKGLDAYSKTWLSLAFPLYMFLIVFAIIKLCQYSKRFSDLIGKRNPVAALSTLILFSYSKILNVTISILSYSDLQYPDGSSERVWTVDGSVKYLNQKHIVLVALAIVIYAVGCAYTVLIFSWQWLLRIQHWKVFHWTRNPRVITFIETYTTPYKARQRYWTGLLLIARAIVYLIAATNASGDPRTILKWTSLIIGGILFWKCVIGSRVYKNRVIDVLETFFYFNVFTAVTATWYTFELDADNTVYMAVSTTVSLLLLLGIVFYPMGIMFYEWLRLWWRNIVARELPEAPA